MNIRKTIIMATAFAATLLTLGLSPAQAQEKSRYMGGEVTLKTAPNSAVVMFGAELSVTTFWTFPRELSTE